MIIPLLVLAIDDAEHVAEALRAAVGFVTAGTPCLALTSVSSHCMPRKSVTYGAGTQDLRRRLNNERQQCAANRNHPKRVSRSASAGQTGPMPQASHGQVVIQGGGWRMPVLEPPDALQRVGMYAPPPTASDLPGPWKRSGGCSRRRSCLSRSGRGDKVCPHCCPVVAIAEYGRKRPPPIVLPVPKAIEHGKEAACLPETASFTVWVQTVFMRGGLKAGERFLVLRRVVGHRGPTAIQAGTRIRRTGLLHEGHRQKVLTPAARNWGAEAAINYRDTDFVDVLKAEGGRGSDLDMVGWR